MRTAVREPVEHGPGTPRLFLIACGALARELGELLRFGDLVDVELSCLPAELHNRPERIPDAVRTRIRRARRDGHTSIAVGYADCGTGGLLDTLCAEEGVERLPGAHCYELFAGREAFAQMHDEAPGTFYLTDYLVRTFDRLVVAGLGLDRHPELLPQYFGNYTRLVYLAQTDDARLLERARAAAAFLGLDFEVRRTGLVPLRDAVGPLARLPVHAA